MDKYLTYPGKQPVYLGDVDFLQTSVAGAMKELLRAYIGDNSGNAILLGCEFSYAHNQISWTSGIVAINGEVLAIQAGTLSGEGTNYFEVISSLGGARTFGDGQQHDCFEYRQATISKTNTGYGVATFPRIASRDTQFAKIFGFYGISNTPTSYARLAFCGGAWHLSLRMAAMDSASTTIFEGTTDALPDVLVQLFQQANAPGSMLISVRSVLSTSSTIVATLSWSISGKKVTFAITAATAVQLTEWFVDEVLPVF